MPADPPCHPIEALSPRRRELLELIAKGLTNDEIAGALAISPATVRTHVTALLASLDVTNRTEAAALYIAWESRPSQVEAVLERPAIAVLPLLAIGDDPHIRALAAGLTEDLASLFARWCWFPVIATVASNAARTPDVPGAAIAARLGARFLVDGSVRTDGRRCRLAIHVDDHEVGHRLWSAQHDFDAGALFATQDELCQAVVGAAYPVLVARALARPRVRAAEEIAAWELAHDGMILRATRSPEANAAAAERFRRAIACEPGLVLAHFGLGQTAYDAALNQWGSRAAALDELAAAAGHCLDRAPDAAEGYYLLGRYRQARGEWAHAVEPLETAVGRNPSFAIAHASLAQSLQVVGKSDEGLTRMRHASRLGPSAFVVGLATLHFMRGEYAEALVEAERAVVTNPRYSFGLAIAAAAAYWGGQHTIARRHHAALTRLSPPFRAAGFVAMFGPEVDAVGRLGQALDALR